MAGRPDKAPEWIARKRADLADPEFRRFYLTYDEAHDWNPGDPRLEELAAAMVEHLIRKTADAGVASADWTELGALSDDEQALLSAHVNGYSPAWLRLNELVAQRVQASASRPRADC